jgi:hypothetical protein
LPSFSTPNTIGGSNSTSSTTGPGNLEVYVYVRANCHKMPCPSGSFMTTQVFEGPDKGKGFLTAQFNAPNCGTNAGCSEGHKVAVDVGRPYSIITSISPHRPGHGFTYEYANIGPAAGHISNANCVGSNSCLGIIKPGTTIVGVNFHWACNAIGSC